MGPAQPFASLTSHGSLSVCFLIWWVEMHSHVHFQSEHRDSVEESGRSPWQMPGPQYSTCGAALSVCVTHRAIFLHPQASGLARTPGASGRASVSTGVSGATRNSGLSGWPRDFMLSPKLSIRFYLLIKLMRNPRISCDKAGGVSAVCQGHRGHSPVRNAPE